MNTEKAFMYILVAILALIGPYLYSVREHNRNASKDRHETLLIVPVSAAVLIILRKIVVRASLPLLTRFTRKRAATLMANNLWRSLFYTASLVYGIRSLRGFCDRAALEGQSQVDILNCIIKGARHM